MRIVFAVCTILLLAGCGNNRVQKAEELIRVGAIQEAHGILTEEIKDNPSNAEAFFTLGKVFEEKQQLDEAFATFESATKANPNYSQKVGDYLWQKVKSENATDPELYLEQAFAINPRLESNEEAVYARYVTYNPEEIEKYLAKFPNGKRKAEALLKLADRLYTKRDFAASHRVYQQLCKECPGSSQAISAQAKLGDWWEERIVKVSCDCRSPEWLGSTKKGTELQIVPLEPNKIIANQLGSWSAEDLRVMFASAEEVNVLSYESPDATFSAPRRARGISSWDIYLEWRKIRNQAEKDVRIGHVGKSGWSGEAPRGSSAWLVVARGTADGFFEVKVRTRPADPAYSKMPKFPDDPEEENKAELGLLNDNLRRVWGDSGQTPRDREQAIRWLTSKTKPEDWPAGTNWIGPYIKQEIPNTFKYHSDIGKFSE